MRYDKFSVLMSVYYKENPVFLDRALRSILIDQTIKPNEVVIIKDGLLTKELNATIEKYEKRFSAIVKTKQLEENVGLGEALKIGIFECSNEIIARMDSDDISLPRRFEKQLSFINNLKVDIVGCNTLFFEENENDIYAKKIFPENHDEIVKRSKYRSPISHAGSMYKKSAILKSGNYSGKFLFFEDYYLWVRMIKNGFLFYNIQEFLYKVRAPRDFYERKRGYDYMKTEIKLYNYFLSSKHINFFEYTFYLFPRIIIRLLPKSLVRKIYNVFLRENVKIGEKT